MKLTAINAEDAPAAEGSYSQATLLQDHARLLFVSGQIPQRADGFVPLDFTSQCQLVWQNIAAQLSAAGMTVDNLVKVTTFLSSRDHAAENSRVRQRVLGSHTPALTVIIADIYDPAWLLEIEAIAAA